MISIVVAASENNAIGKDNQLLWTLPNDLKFFKKQTTGKVIVMGRKTFESIGSKPLPNRTNVVITRNPEFSAEGVAVFHSLKDALDHYRDEPEICIVGGEQIFREGLGYTDVVYITRVHAVLDGDTFFPELNDSGWLLVEEEKHGADEKHKYAYTFQTYRRI
jgi:dihydrofolate reductase